HPTSTDCPLPPPHPSHLHSFPTRRSSDLSRPAPAPPPARAASPRDSPPPPRPARGAPIRTGTPRSGSAPRADPIPAFRTRPARRSEEHTSELQSRFDIVCRLLLEKKKISI